MQQHIYHLSIKKRGAKAPEIRQLESVFPLTRAFLISLFGLDGPTVEEYTIREEGLPLFYGHKKRFKAPHNY